VKQDPVTKAGKLADYYGPSNAEWLWKRDLDMQVSCAIFPYKGKELMVDAGKECVVYLMDTDSIGGDDHRTPLHLGFDGDLGRRKRHALGVDAVLGAEAFKVERSDRKRPGQMGRDCRVQSDG
jgi:hypothetical protein